MRTKEMAEAVGMRKGSTRGVGEMDSVRPELASWGGRHWRYFQSLATGAKGSLD